MTTHLSSYVARSATIAGAAVALTLGVAGGAQAAPRSAALTVPSIHETFTHQTCPAHAGTTVALENCAGDRVLTLDARINRLDRAIVTDLPAQGRAEFVRATREWIAYRTVAAEAAASADQGGSIAPLVQLGALGSEDAAHITALTREFTTATGRRP